MFLINGQLQTMIAANDRSVQFGDGCFTTARVVNGEVRFMRQHMARLRRDSMRLGIEGIVWQTLADEMRRLAVTHSQAVLKVVLSRGVGGRGYAPASGMTATRILSVTPYPQHYARWREDGVTLAVSTLQLGKNPHLAGLKHLNRLEQVFIRRELANSSADEAVVLDSDGMVVECCAANLLWRQNDMIFTPSLHFCGVEGTMRRYVLQRLAEAGWPVQQVRAPLSALMQADEIILCNALMPVVPVAGLNGRRFSAGHRRLLQFLAPRCE